MGFSEEHWSNGVDAWGTRISRRFAAVRADLSLAGIEAALIVVAYAAALSVRFLDSSGGVPPIWWGRLLLVLPVIILVHTTANTLFGNYGHVWQYASVDEAVRLLAASMTAGFVLLTGLLMWRRFSGVTDAIIPVSVLVIGVLVTLGGMGAIRFWSRLFSYRRYREMSGTHDRAIIVGIGGDAVQGDLAW